MNYKSLALALFSCSGLVAIESGFDRSAMAQCVQADVSVQYNISGSQEPTDRVNDVDMQSNPSCVGNANVTVGVQGNEGGTSRVRQERVVRQRINSDGDQQDGTDRSTVQVRSNVGVDVYNPAEKLLKR